MLQRSLVRFGWALMADGGRKFALEGRREAARDGGRLFRQYTRDDMIVDDLRAHFGITIVLVRDSAGGVRDGTALEHAPGTVSFALLLPRDAVLEQQGDLLGCNASFFLEPCVL